MMAEDAGLELWAQIKDADRLSQRSSRYVELTFEPDDERVRNLAWSLVRGQYCEDFCGGVSRFVQMMARTIVERGAFAYELQFGCSPMSNEVEAIRFVPVFTPDGRVVRVGQRCMQVVRPRVAAELGCSCVVRLVSDCTFAFEAFPKWRRELRIARSASRLYERSEHDTMRRITEAMSGKTYAGNHEDDSLKNITMLAKATAPIGWTARGLFRDYNTEYQFMERAIRWQQFCLDLRRSILEELQRAVARIAREVNSACRLKIVEHEPEPLTEIYRKLRSGSTSFVALGKSLF